MAKRRPKVLILDGDKESCLALHRALFEASTHFDILLATTAESAREIMRDSAIDVLVTDVDAPASGAVDLMCWAAIEFPEALYVVQTSHDVDDLQQRMAGLGCLRLVKKPCSPKEVLKIVHEALDCTHRLSGCFSTLSAADLIQMLCLAQRTAALRITANGEAGSVMVKDGQLLHATWGRLVGQPALCEILDAHDGVFRTTPLPDGIERTIEVSWQHALMEAVHELDERASSTHRKSGSFPAIRIDDSVFDKMSSQAPAGESRRTPTTALLSGAESRTSPRPGGVASSLVDKGFAALRAGNAAEARECWLAAKQLDPENRALDLNLKILDSRANR
jgi:DNA-binding NarL/FixJ family response regulator